MKSLATTIICALFLTGCVEYTYLELNGVIWHDNPELADGAVRAAGFELDTATGYLVWYDGAELHYALTTGHIDCKCGGSTGRFEGPGAEGTFSIQTKTCKSGYWPATEDP